MKKSTRGGPRNKTGPKLGAGGKRNKLRICLTSDVEAFWKRHGDTLGEAIETYTRRMTAFKRLNATPTHCSDCGRALNERGGGNCATCEK